MSSEIGYATIFGGNKTSPGLSGKDSPINNWHSDAVQVSSPNIIAHTSEDDEARLFEADDIQDESYDSSSSLDRPNRLKGNANRWRYLTANERSLAASLDRIEDDDLSIHLYNVHSLKRRLYRPGVHASSTQDSSEERPRKRTFENWHRKERWIAGHDEKGSTNWYPNRLWAAWPLEPHLVPRPGEQQARNSAGDVSEERWTVKKSNDATWKPSQEMEDLVLAEFLKKARKRFGERDTEELQHSSERHGRCSDRKLGKEPGMVLGQDVPRQRLSNLRGPPENSKSTDDAVNYHGRRVKRTSSWNDGLRSDSAWSRSGADTSADETARKGSALKPVVMADDDKAHHLLKLPIRHILYKLDNLLMGLHHSRHNHLDYDGYDSGTDTTQSRESSVVRSRKSPDRLTQRRNHSRSKLRNRRKSPASQFERARTLNELRPRDWSEVLGTATMTGWDREAVHRAAARCSQLFGERMDFRNLGGSQPVGDDPDQDGDDPDGMKPSRRIYGSIHEDHFLKPIILRRPQAKRAKNVSQGPAQVGADVEATSISSEVSE